MLLEELKHLSVSRQRSKLHRRRKEPVIIGRGGTAAGWAVAF
jgi:hypothetical protein